MLLAGLFFAAVAVPVSAEEDTSYYLGDFEKVKTDSGFSKPENLELDDPHYGWSLGRFVVQGHSQVQKTESGTPVILKSNKDRVILKFELNQDIEKLNGKENLQISTDENGYDSNFGIEKTNFGKGMLVVRKTDPQNKREDPTVYTDYLTIVQADPNSKDAIIELNEAGEYQIALDYEIKNNKHVYFGQSILPGFTNYRIVAEFIVANGNAMVYPMEIESGNELTNQAYTDKGFYLDLANSPNLNITVKKEVLNDTESGLTEDTRYNRAAKDKEEFSEEGIYTISVLNPYTSERTEKVIHVGTNRLLRAAAVNGKTVSEIKQMTSEGREILEDGTLSDIQLLPEETEPEEEPAENLQETAETETDAKPETEPEAGSSLPVAAGVVLAVILALGVFFGMKKAGKEKMQK